MVNEPVDLVTTARLWADQLERDIANPGIRSGTMIWMPWQAIKDVADVIRELADAHSKATSGHNRAGREATDA